MRTSRCCLLLSFSVLLASQLAPAYAADSAFVFRNRVVAVQAEDLPHTAAWQFATSKAGYTGRGYLTYKGPERAPAAPNQQNWENPPEQNDLTGQYQGSASDRLNVTVQIDTTGVYFVNAYTAHDWHCFEPWCMHDGDVTVWTHMNGYTLPVRFNFAHSHTSDASWMFMKFGPGLEGSDIPYNAPFSITQKGVYTFYVAGRDPNFKIDRIHIYRIIGRSGTTPLYPPDHDNPNALLSTKVAVQTVGQAPRAMVMSGRAVKVRAIPDAIVVDGVATGDVVEVCGLNGELVSRVTANSASATVAASFRGTALVRVIRDGALSATAKVLTVKR